MNESETPEPAASDSVLLEPEKFANQAVRKNRACCNKKTFRAVWAALLFVACLVAVTVAVAAPVRPDASSVLQTKCFLYTNFSESLQPTSGCERALAGNCSTAPGVCVAFAFLADTNASSVTIGTMYRCGDPSCTGVGSDCRCANPAIFRATAFCRRHLSGKEYGGANFACY